MIGNLTSREVDVGRELLRGERLSKIALRLGMSQDTVKNHVCNMSWKLGRTEDGISVRVFVAVKLSEAARKYPLVAAALEV